MHGPGRTQLRAPPSARRRTQLLRGSRCRARGRLPFEREKGERRQPVLPHVTPHVGKAALARCEAAASSATTRRGSPGRHASSPATASTTPGSGSARRGGRSCHPSGRSPSTGEEKGLRAGRYDLGEKPPEPSREFSRCEHPPHAFRLDQCGREKIVSARLPRLAIHVVPIPASGSAA